MVNSEKDATMPPDPLIPLARHRDAAACEALMRRHNRRLFRLVRAMLGNDAEAERWFDLLQTAEDVPAAVLDQVFSRRLVVYAQARRWSDLQRLVVLQQHRTGQPLTVPDARLLGVLTLEAAGERAGIAGREELVASLAQTAFRDLIARGDLGQVIDLVNRYGTAPIGADGFVPGYVRAVKAYDRALEAHREAGGTPDQPAGSPQVITLFREAADVLTKRAVANFEDVKAAVAKVSKK